jgi:spermidine dehydrogenase
MPESPDTKRDKELGMDRKITRRDFLDGAALTVGGAMLAGSAVGGSAALLGGCGDSAGTLVTPASAPYPPALTGLRGSIDPAYAVPHALRDGTFWKGQSKAKDTGESYDLVVVGAGISGLTAAYLYAARNPDARVLVLENHDDFGGHARRNEFTPVVGRFGRLIIGYGGTQSIDHPKVYRPNAKKVMQEIGVRIEPFTKYYDSTFYEKAGVANSATFFDQETWGSDYLAIETPDMPLGQYDPAFLKDVPISEQAKKDLAMLRGSPKDWLPGLSQEEKWAKLTELTYEQWLKDYAKVDPDAVKYLSKASSGYWGYGADGIGAIDAWADWYPGFDGLKLSWAKPYKDNAPTEKQFWEGEPYIYHYPDGCHGIARLLVRQLVPEALPGHTQEDQVLARLDYSRLDDAANRTRIRLSSPVVKVSNTSSGVDVTYVQNGELRSVKGKGAVMACWYSILPFIVDGYPEEQKQAARYMTRIPLLYASMQISNWRAFKKLTIQRVSTIGPGSFWLGFDLDMPVSMGGYEHPSDPDQPIVLHWNATPAKLGMPPREGVKVGRQELYKMSFTDLERKMRDLTARSLSSGGFDPANDIQAITINRWAHGYSFEYAMPWDKAFYPDGPLPGDVAAKPFGRITFANTDRSSQAYVDSAMDAATKAVDEQNA